MEEKIKGLHLLFQRMLRLMRIGENRAEIIAYPFESGYAITPSTPL